MKNCSHKWLFDFHYLDKREYHSYADQYAETAVYHCEKCGKVERHPIWIDAYEGDHD